MGDFNSVLHPNEKTGGGAFNHRAGAKFANASLTAALQTWDVMGLCSLGRVGTSGKGKIVHLETLLGRTFSPKAMLSTFRSPPLTIVGSGSN